VIGGLCLFVALYVWAAFNNDISRGYLAMDSSISWLPLGLVGGALAMVFGAGPDWLLLFIYAGAIAGSYRPRSIAAVGVVVLTLVTAGSGLLTGATWPGLGQTLFLVVSVGGIVTCIGWTPRSGRRATNVLTLDDHTAPPRPAVIRTPDQRLRVFVSSTLEELAAEREAAQAAVTHLHLSPVLFELGARPHPPRALYQAYLEQSDIFVGIYWQRYGWVAPDMLVSGLEDEYASASNKPKLVYIKRPAPDRDARLTELLDRIKQENKRILQVVLITRSAATPHRKRPGPDAKRTLYIRRVSFIFTSPATSCRPAAACQQLVYEPRSSAIGG
jgi:hypothetical protein